MAESTSYVMLVWGGEKAKKKITSNLSVWLRESGFNPIFNMSAQNCVTVAAGETHYYLLTEKKADVKLMVNRWNR